MAAIYPVGDGDCNNGGWEQSIHAEAAGGNGTYMYYWEGNPVGGPTSSPISFNVRGAGGPVIGKIRVVSGDQVYEEDFFVPAPSCN